MLIVKNDNSSKAPDVFKTYLEFPLSKYLEKVLKQTLEDLKDFRFVIEKINTLI